MRGGIIIAAVILVISLCISCKDKQAKTQTTSDDVVQVGRTSVSWVRVNADGEAIRDEAMEKALGSLVSSRLEDNGRIVAGVTGRDPLDVAVVASTPEPEIPTDDLGIPTDAPALVPEDVALLCSMRTTFGDGWKISSSIATTIPVKMAETPDAIPEQILDDLIEGLLEQLELFDASTGELVATVQDASVSPDARSTAIRILGEKRDVTAAPELAKVLDDTPSDDPLMEDLVAALGKIGEESASPSLISAFGRAEPYQAMIIVDSLGATGGDEARKFLAVVASGHQSPSVREHAARMLASMDNDAD